MLREAVMEWCVLEKELRAEDEEESLVGRGRARVRAN
jgi:hypothetical protein